MVEHAPCDLPSDEYNLASAWWGPPNRWFPSGWRALHHACGPIVSMRACGCPLCWERAEQLEAPERRDRTPPSAAATRPATLVPVEPVRLHVRQLLARGWSRERIALAAHLDKTTLGRVLRPDVRRVRVDTAAALLAI